MGGIPTYYQPQPVVALTTPKMDEVADQLLSTFDSTIEDQSGCRFLQTRLEDKKTSPEMITKLYTKVVENVGKYMCLPFGNYLCQKLFELLGEEQLYVIFKRIKTSVVEIAKNLHGTRSVQQLIKVAVGKSGHLKEQVIGILKGKVSEISMVPVFPFPNFTKQDPNGNHVILLCLQQLKAPDNSFIYGEIMGNCTELAKHKHGCCIVQKSILAANDTQKVLKVEGFIGTRKNNA